VFSLISGKLKVLDHLVVDVCEDRIVSWLISVVAIVAVVPDNFDSSLFLGHNLENDRKRRSLFPFELVCFSFPDMACRDYNRRVGIMGRQKGFWRLRYTAGHKNPKHNFILGLV
jgi:hypothetical protein